MSLPLLCLCECDRCWTCRASHDRSHTDEPNTLLNREPTINQKQAIKKSETESDSRAEREHESGTTNALQRPHNTNITKIICIYFIVKRATIANGRIRIQPHAPSIYIFFSCFFFCGVCLVCILHKKPGYIEIVSQIC